MPILQSSFELVIVLLQESTAGKWSLLNRSPYAGSNDGKYEPLEDNNDGNNDADDWLEDDDAAVDDDYHHDNNDYDPQVWGVVRSTRDLWFLWFVKMVWLLGFVLLSVAVMPLKICCCCNLILCYSLIHKVLTD